MSEYIDHMEQASRPSQPNTEVDEKNPEQNDLRMIHLALDESDDELLEEVYTEDDDDDTISKGSNDSNMIFP